MSSGIREFLVTEDHIKLLRHAYVSYDDWCEYGAPIIDPKRPYGNSSVECDIIEILTGEAPDEDKLGSHAYERLLEDERWHKTHRQTEVALQIVLSTGQFKPGLYRTTRPYDSTSWALVDSSVGVY